MVGWRRGACLYLPAGIPAGPGPVYACEGASDTDAVHAAGLPAIGRNNARPHAESLARLDTGAVYRVWPDHDTDGAGYRQAVTWHDAATAAGLRVELIDPLALRPDAAPGFDARDWLSALPDGAGATALLDSSLAPVDVIRERGGAVPRAGVAGTVPAGTFGTIAPGFPAPVQRALDSLTDEGLGAAAGRLRALGGSRHGRRTRQGRRARRTGRGPSRAQRRSQDARL